jgi:hypothetical protein
MDNTSLFIPAGHVLTRTRRTHLWQRPQGGRTEPWAPLLDDLVIEMERHLSFEIRCRLHVVVYSTNEEARATLGRAVPTSMLLAPVQGPDDSVIAVQSVAADARNGDCGRMRRHLCHELAHVMVALRTGSEKRLGDGDRDMHVSPWVNEGFAVCVAAMITGRLDLIEEALAGEPAWPGRQIDLDVALNDLNGENRSAAFAIATARLWRAIQTHGLDDVFANLANSSWDWGSVRTRSVR